MFDYIAQAGINSIVGATVNNLVNQKNNTQTSDPQKTLNPSTLNFLRASLLGHLPKSCRGKEILDIAFVIFFGVKALIGSSNELSVITNKDKILQIEYDNEKSLDNLHLRNCIYLAGSNYESPENLSTILKTALIFNLEDTLYEDIYRYFLLQTKCGRDCNPTNISDEQKQLLKQLSQALALSEFQISIIESRVIEIPVLPLQLSDYRGYYPPLDFKMHNLALLDLEIYDEDIVTVVNVMNDDAFTTPYPTTEDYVRDMDDYFGFCDRLNFNQWFWD